MSPILSISRYSGDGSDGDIGLESARNRLRVLYILDREIQTQIDR
jgi:hypothetical protein